MTAHIVIARTDAEQPWHVRIVGANGEPIVSGENLATKANARTAVRALARTFGWKQPHMVYGLKDAPPCVLVDADGARLEVRHLDERATSEPTA